MPEDSEDSRIPFIPNFPGNQNNEQSECLSWYSGCVGCHRPPLLDTVVVHQCYTMLLTLPMDTFQDRWIRLQVNLEQWIRSSTSSALRYTSM
uniref:Uncharacterized protein n=1 Tax=Arundo donax TaxID=35708 RepID=A0A0A9DH33_ARUDO